MHPLCWQCRSFNCLSIYTTWFLLQPSDSALWWCQSINLHIDVDLPYYVLLCVVISAHIVHYCPSGSNLLLQIYSYWSAQRLDRINSQKEDNICLGITGLPGIPHAIIGIYIESRLGQCHYQLLKTMSHHNMNMSWHHHQGIMWVH